ncbi:MAG: beta-lactamase family protein [Acidobacteria bacterium]|nr:beta-lactamase family protein [Acidobacteriota bacterium]
MLLLLPLCLPVMAASLIVSKPEDSGMSAERLQRLKAGMKAYIDRHEVAGTVTLIARRGRIVHLEAQGMADIEARKALTNDSIFRLASMTKPITSVAVMMLLEEGKFLLSDPVSRFIPEFKNSMVKVINPPGSSRQGFKLVPAANEITIRDLLSHSAGLAGPTSVALQADLERFRAETPKGETIAQYTRRLAKLPLNFHPGTAWEYGPATNVLGYLVEVVSGMPLDRFFADRIFKPLGMTDTFFYVPDNKLDRLVTLYRPEGGTLRPVAPARQQRGSNVFFSGAGGLSGTAEDYFRFCQMLLNRGSYNGARLLSPKSVQLMTANHIADHPIWPDLAGYRFGLGFRVMTDLGQSGHLDSIGSYGWGGAHGTYFWIDPKEDMLGILMIQATSYKNIRIDAQGLAMQSIVQ